MDGTRKHCVKQNKPDAERQIMQDTYKYHINIHIFVCMWPKKPDNVWGEEEAGREGEIEQKRE